MLMSVHTTPSQVKRRAVNMHRAAGRMRELLIDLASATCGHSTPEICDIREIIAEASDTAAAATDNRRVQILLDVRGEIKLPLARSRMKLMFFNLITKRSWSHAGWRRGSHWGRKKPRSRPGRDRPRLANLVNPAIDSSYRVAPFVLKPESQNGPIGLTTSGRLVCESFVRFGVVLGLGVPTLPTTPMQNDTSCRSSASKPPQYRQRDG
jgi:hypothetical protein